MEHVDLATVVTVASRSSLTGDGGMGAFPLDVPSTWLPWFQRAVVAGEEASGVPWGPEKQAWYNRSGGWLWTEYAHLQALQGWSSSPGLPLLNLACDWHPWKTLAAQQGFPDEWYDNLTTAWAYGNSTAAVRPRRELSQVRDRALQSEASAALPYSGGLLVTRAQLYEPLALLADVWVLPRGITYGSAGSLPGAGAYWGYNGALGGPRAIQRAVVTGAGTLFIPDGTGDSRLPGQGARSADVLTSTNPYSSLLTTLGVSLTVRTVSWRLIGIPSPWLLTHYSITGLTPPHSQAAPHAVVLTSTAVGTVVAPGTLLPGYVYTVTATLDASASLVYGGPLHAPPTPASPSISGTVSPSSNSTGPARRLWTTLTGRRAQEGDTPSAAQEFTWTDPVSRQTYSLTSPSVLTTGSAAGILAVTGGTGVGAESISIAALPIRAAQLYIHSPPTAGSLLRVPANGTALLTRFQLNSTGWMNDLQARSSAPVPAAPALAYHATMSPQPPAWVSAWGGLLTSGSAAASAVYGQVTGPGSACVAARRLPRAPSWYARQGVLGALLGQGNELVCATVESSTRAALSLFMDTYGTSVLPLNYRGAPAQVAAAAGTTPGSALIHSFRVDLTGATPNITQDRLGNPRLYAQQAADAALFPSSWVGAPLSAPTAAAGAQFTLPLPSAGSVVQLFTYVRDEEGAVGYSWNPARVTLQIAGTEDAGSLGAASATSSFVTQVASGLTKESVTNNPFGALLTANSLSTVLSNASSSSVVTGGFGGGGTGSNATVNNTAVEELRRNNTALRDSLVDTVSTAVASIANASTAGIGANALDGLLGNFTIVVAIASPEETGQGRQTGPINAGIVGNISSEALQALRADTSIALDDGTASAAATALAGLTSDPTELSTQASTTALQSLQTVLALSLPTNVLLGVSDDGQDILSVRGTSTGGDGRPAQGGSDDATSNSTLQSVVTVSPPSPALIAASASITLNVLTSASFLPVPDELEFRPNSTGVGVGGNGTGTGTGEGSNSTEAPPQPIENPVRQAAKNALTILTSTMNRDARPGDAPRSVSAGPSVAFRRATNRVRKLQGLEELPEESFCGQALMLTTARLTASVNSTTVPSSYDVPMSEGFNPCLSNVKSERAREIMAGELTAARVVITQGFMSAGGATARVADLQIVQMTQTFGLPEERGFAAISYSPAAPAVPAGRGGRLLQRVGAVATDDESKARQSSWHGRALSLLDRILGDTPLTAGGAIAAAGLSTSTQTSVRDLNPSTGLDSRVLQVNLQTRSGRSIPIDDAPEPILITIPLRDVSLPGSSRAGALASSNEIERYTFTCPAEADRTKLSAGMRLPAIRNNSTRDGSVNSTQASWVTLAGKTRISYVSSVADLPYTPSSCKLPFANCDEDGVPRTDGFSISNAVQQASDAAVQIGTGGLVRTSRTVYIITMACGGLAGPRNVTCGPGGYGNTTTFECPAVESRPVCAFFDERLGRWSNEGCTVVDNSKDDSVTCACTHLTEFAVRFAALAADNRDIFAQLARLDLVDRGRALLMMGVVGFILCALVASAVLTKLADRRGDARFYITLLADEEVQFMRKIEQLKGNAFILDRTLDAEKEGRELAAMEAQVAKEQQEGEGVTWTNACSRCCKKQGPVSSTRETRSWFGSSASAASRSSRDSASMGVHPKGSDLDSGNSIVMSNPMLMVAGRQVGTSPGKPLPIHVESEASRRARIEARYTQGSAVDGTAVAAELAVEDIAGSRTARGADAYTAALYLRLMQAFDAYRVTPDRLDRSIVERVVSQEVVEEMSKGGKDGAGFLKEEGGVTSPMSRPTSPLSGAISPRSALAPRMAFQPYVEPKAVSASHASSHSPGASRRPVLGRRESGMIVSFNPARNGRRAALEPESAFTRGPVPRMNSTLSEGSGSGDAVGGGVGLASTRVIAGPAASTHGTAQGLSKLQSFKSTIMDRARAKMAILDDTSSWSCVRMWRLRKFILRVWSLRLWYTHPYISIYTRYDPRSPRTGRLFVISAIIMGNLFVTAFFYAFRNGRPGQDLPEMSTVEIIVVSLLAAIIQQPVEAAVKAIIEWSGRSEFTHRYPYIWSELNRRREAEKKLAGMSRAALAAELAMSDKSTKEDAVVLADKMARQAALTAANAQARALSKDSHHGPSALGSSRGLLGFGLRRDPGATSPPAGPSTGHPAWKAHTAAMGLRDAGEPQIPGSTYLSDAAANGLLAHSAARKGGKVSHALSRHAQPPELPPGLASAVVPRIDSGGAGTRARRTSYSAEEDSEPAFEYGWVDAPASVIRWCAPLLWACGRHPSQKAAYIAQFAAAEAARIHKQKIRMMTALAERAAKRQRSKANVGSFFAGIGPTAGTGLTVATGAAAMQAGLERQMLPGSGELGVQAVDEGSDEEEGAEDEDGVEGGEGGTGQEVVEDLETMLGGDKGDFAVLFCTALCGVVAAATAGRGARATTTALGSGVSSRFLGSFRDNGKGKAKRDSVLGRGKRRGSASPASGATKTKQRKKKLSADAKERKQVEAEEARQAEIAETASGYLRSACGVLPCTTATAIAYAIVLLWVAFCLFYLTLFGLYQPQGATVTFLESFALSQAFALFLLQPAILLFVIVFQLAIFPAWVPYVLWVPVLGPMVAGKAASSMQAQAGTAALTGRLENLTLVRAAGAASMLAPDSALIAYGTTAVLGAAMGKAGEVISRITADAKRREKARKGGKDEEDGTSATLASLTEAERHELIVRRYLVAQLKVAEATRKKRSSRKLKALSFAVTAAGKTGRAMGQGQGASGTGSSAIITVSPASTASTPVVPAAPSMSAALMAMRAQQDITEASGAAGSRSALDSSQGPDPTSPPRSGPVGRGARRGSRASAPSSPN